MKTTKPSAYELQRALIAMVTRYGSAAQKNGICSPDGTIEGKSSEFWWRARQRRFAAVQRLAAALRDAEAVQAEPVPLNIAAICRTLGAPSPETDLEIRSVADAYPVRYAASGAIRAFALDGGPLATYNFESRTWFVEVTR